MGFFVVKGLIRGFVREISSLAGVILGIILANQFQPQMSSFLKAYLPHTQFLPLISFAALFFAVLIGCNLLGWGLNLLFKKAFLGWVDRTLGVGFALIKGVILTYLVIVILTFFLPARTPLIARSLLAPIIVTSYQAMVRVISPEHYENWKKKILGGTRALGDAVSEKVKNMTVRDGQE